MTRPWRLFTETALIAVAAAVALHFDWLNESKLIGLALFWVCLALVQTTSQLTLTREELRELREQIDARPRHERPLQEMFADKGSPLREKGNDR